MISKNLRYIQKIKHDLDEHHYDRFIHHLLQIGNEIKIYEEKALIIPILDKAIKEIQSKTHDKNKVFMYRYQLIAINKILLLNKEREDLKQLKKEIVADYTHKESKTEKIPLNDQLTEARITYEPSYLIHLTKHFKETNPIKSLYCYEAVKLIEPDNILIDELDEHFNKLHPIIEINYKINEIQPKDKLLIIDSNIIISRTLKDIPEFSNNVSEIYNLELLGNNNKFAIPKCVEKEVDQNIGIKCTQLKYQNHPRASEIKQTIKKKVKKFIENHRINAESDTKQAIEFYNKYIPKLRSILHLKLKNQPKLSYKLRKLAQRDNLLPEEGDLKLLASAIALKEQYPNIAILSNDIDFQAFKDEIKEAFGIDVI